MSVNNGELAGYEVHVRTELFKTITEFIRKIIRQKKLSP